MRLNENPIYYNQLHFKEITYEELLKLHYMEAVIKETLRLSPRLLV